MEKNSRFGVVAASILALSVCGVFSCKSEAPLTPPKVEDTIPDTLPDTTLTPKPRTIRFRVMGVEVDSVLMLSYKAQSVEVEVIADSSWGAVVSVAEPWVEVKSDRTSDVLTVDLLSDNLDDQARSVSVMVASGGISAKLRVVQQSSALALSTIDSLALVALYNALDGPYWTTPSGDVAWDLKLPVSTWYGVRTVIVDGQMRVSSLNLSSMQLDGEMPSQIGALTALQTLDIRKNTVKGILPDEIANLVNLEKLYIDENKFTGEIPGVIAQLKRLKELSAMNNRLSTFPVEICQADSLTVIHLEKNEISTLPGEITEMTRLEYLYLNENKLTALPQGLDKMPSLLYFHAQKNQIETLPQQIGLLTKLLSLNLSENKISGSIPASLVNLTELKYLYLSDNALSGSLPQGMEKMSALLNIEINNNQLSGPLHDFGKNPLIEQVQFEGNSLECDITGYFEGCPALEWVMLGGNRLFGSVPLALADIKKCPQLSYLSLSGNNLSGGISAGFADQLDKYSPKFNEYGFRLYGNKLSGEIPQQMFDIAWGRGATKFKYDTNLYPQQDGFVFTNMQ